LDSHLSRPYVAVRLKPPLRTAGQALCPPTVLLLDRVYRTGQSPAGQWALTSLFHPYRLYCRRFISVALFLKSPSAGVTRYPCPMEPGLSSCTNFRSIHATVWLTR